MVTSYGLDWETDLFFEGLEQGARMKLEINSIDNDYTSSSGNYIGEAILYYINLGKWSKTNLSESLQLDNSGYLYGKDFDGYLTNIYYSLGIGFLVLTPTEDFLSGQANVLSPSYYTVVGNKIIAEYEATDPILYPPDSTVTFYSEYNKNGVLSTCEIYNEFDQLIFKMILVKGADTVPGFNPLIILMTSSVFLIGVLLIVRKKIKS